MTTATMHVGCRTLFSLAVVAAVICAVAAKPVKPSRLGCRTLFSLAVVAAVVCAVAAKPVKPSRLGSRTLFSLAVVATVVCAVAAKPVKPSRLGSRTLFSLAVVAAVICAVAAKPVKPSRLEKYTTLCRIADPKISQCMTNAMKDILKLAKTGIPELEIPPFEPFNIKEIDLKVFQGLGLFGGNQKSDKYKAFARNLVIHHSSEFVLHDLKADVEKKEFFVNLTFPKLRVEGEYDVNLNLFNMPIKSTGPVFINATDILVVATLNGQTITMKDDKYLMFDSIEIKVNFRDYSILIDKLFKKDQNLNRALNDMIKSQKAELKTMTLPMIEEVAGKMVLTLVNQILSRMPLDEIFITE